ncbi:MAG: YbjQ family protein [Candidatus Micrarchaeota archaeon]
MKLVTTDFIVGKEITETMGVVKGNTIRAKHLGKDILAGFRHIVGGELIEYTEMLTESREEAIKRMTEDAERIGADAIINVRFMTSEVTQGAAEILAYGTAVKLK